MSRVFWLGCLGALLYSSWPLGYALNPQVSHNELASMLEAPHQPFNWVFMGSDVLTGIVISVVAYLQLSKIKTRNLAKYGIFFYWLFAALVALAALSKINCDPALQQCGSLIRHPIIIVHGFASISSVVALLACMLLLTKAVYAQQVSGLIRLAHQVVLLAWLFFGVASLIELVFHIRNNALQHYFITICGLSIVSCIFIIEYLQTDRPGRLNQTAALASKIKNAGGE